MIEFQLEQLRTLVAVIDESTFDAAAARLHVTPSAISQRIKAMEQAAGRVLVQRTAPVSATEAGELVLRHARQVLLLTHDTAERLAGAGAGEEEGFPSIPLAVNADSLNTWFGDALARLALSVDAVFELHREDQEHTVELLRRGLVMAAVTATREPVQGCTSQLLGVMRYRAVCSPAFVGRRLGGVAHVARLDGAPLVDFDRKDQLQQRFLARAIGRTPRSPRHQVPSSAEFAQTIVAGLGWGLLPEQQSAQALADGALVELAGADAVEVPLFWQRWNLGSRLLDQVTEAVVAAAGRLG